MGIDATSRGRFEFWESSEETIVVDKEAVVTSLDDSVKDSGVEENAGVLEDTANVVDSRATVVEVSDADVAKVVSDNSIDDTEVVRVVVDVEVETVDNGEVVLIVEIIEDVDGYRVASTLAIAAAISDDK